MRKTAVLLGFLGLAANPATALTPYLVRDINPLPEPESSRPREMTALGGVVVYAAFEAAVGFEPWASDGTAAGTFVLADTCPGPCSGRADSFFATGDGRAFFLADDSLWVTKGTPISTFRLTSSALRFPQLLFFSLWVPAQKRLYFAGDDGIHGSELWTSDGTAVGTYQVADLLPGAASSFPHSFAVFQNKLFFSAAISATVHGLWMSDGTASGTRLVKGGVSGRTTLQHPGGLQALGNVLIFRGYSQAGGFELWKSDGTSKGTVQLLDIEPGPESSSLGHFAVLGKRLLFPGLDSKRGIELWATDGTAKGTRPLTNLSDNGGPTGGGGPRFTLGNRTVFLADDEVHGAEPWVTDGTPAGTRMIKDVCPGACSSVDSSPSPPAVILGNRLYLAMADARGRELWFTDGTAAGTNLVKDVCPGACDSEPEPFAAARGRVFFTADDGTHGVEVWATNGAPRNTVRLTDFGPGSPFSDAWAALPDAVLFAANDGEHGNELWRSDATPAGTRLVADLARRDLGGSFPCDLTAADGQLWFLADGDDDFGYELWTSDGTSGGTHAVFEFLHPFRQCLQLAGAARAGGRTFLLLGDSLYQSLWVSDGTAAGTVPLTESTLDIDSGLFPVGPWVLFLVDSEVWRSDGTVAGTVPVKDLTPGSIAAFPREGTLFNGRLHFSAGGGPDGRELWTSDGTSEGTFVVANLSPGDSSSDPTGLAVFGGKLYFFAETGPLGRSQLWSTDGTAAGTRLAVDLAGFTPPIPAGDRMYLFAAAPGGTLGLWVSDGTAAGTRFLKEVTTSPRFGEIPPVAVGTRLYFTGPGETSTVSRLWTSDGTPEGTRPAVDHAGEEILNPITLHVVGGRLAFNTLVGGEETLWQSDGTAAGTVPVLPLQSLPEHSPGGPGTVLVASGDRLFFAHFDDATGMELWALAP
jgi:ELWxxDGT repeat protein